MKEKGKGQSTVGASKDRGAYLNFFDRKLHYLYMIKILFKYIYIYRVDVEPSSSLFCVFNSDISNLPLS